MKIEELILYAREVGASDIHISEGLPLYFRIHGKLQQMPLQASAEQVKKMILSLLDEKQLKKANNQQDLDFAVETTDHNRQRVNIFFQQKKIAATIRLLNDHIPTLDQLGLPPVLQSLANEKRGLILVTGPTGSGKSTTLASMIDYVNSRKAEHIITVEDPIEYRYETKQSVIHQRELGVDVPSFSVALRSALREDPDIILVGEMRDYETISAAITAAETGHLVLSTLHTTGAAQTIDRIVDVCPSESQGQIRTMLAGMLRGVVTQCLIPKKNGQGRVPATEILVGTDAVSNLIRENKCHQLNSLMQSGASLGMHTLNADLYRLVSGNIIEADRAIEYSNDRKDLEGYLGAY